MQIIILLFLGLCQNRQQYFSTRQQLAIAIVLLKDYNINII